MSGSTFGKNFKISTWGESHGKGIGVVIDGCPSGVPLNEEDIQKFLDRRKPGQSKYTTKRKEADECEILSGVFEGVTTGTPISIIIKNEDQRSVDYSNIKNTYRPGHADFSYDAKYGIRDYRGGGRSSGRETIGRVCAGAVAAKILGKLGIKILTYTKAIHHISIEEKDYDFKQIMENPFYMPNNEKAAEASAYLDSCIKNLDSSGGIIECRVRHMPAGIGDPVFDKLDALLAHALFSIGAVKGVEIGEGFGAALLNGSTNNDTTTASNHAGGILGGISTGKEILLRAAIKPTPSISREQGAMDNTLHETTIVIKGRHDPVIVPRAVVVVESMVCITLLDSILSQLGTRMEYLEDRFNNLL